MPAFPPLLATQPHSLILGSMPSVKSLEAQQYYAHPRNSFWPIMANICGFDGAADYSDRVSQLTDQGFCVWDVLYDCERKGSLDSRIERQSEQANDFDAFFKRNPDIRLVAFNGQAARNIFNRHCNNLYDRYPAIDWVDLPSSSPAHATMTRQEKTRVWSSRLGFLTDEGV